jgi:hypothetical protein
MDQITKIQEWITGQISPDSLRKNPLKLLAVGFGLFVIVLCFYGLGSYRASSGLRTQELQVLNECENKYRSKHPDKQISFQGVYSERFGSTHIIVAGNLSYPDADGHPISFPVNCDVDIASTPWVWAVR